jgi:energy-coupling factor transporter transmembrane protein EcfT
MTAIASELYVPGRSWLHRLDPRPKLWFAALGVVTCLLAQDLPALLAVLALSHAILLAGGVPIRRLAGMWRALMPLLLIILVLQPLVVSGEGPTLWALGPVRITRAGLLQGLIYAVRAASVAFAALIPALTTPVNTLVRGLVRLGLPYPLGLTVGLALRYLGTLGELWETINQAQQARGLVTGRGGVLRRAQAFVPTLVAIIIASLRLRDSLAMALAARGLGARPNRSALHEIAMRPPDWAALAVSTLLLGAVWLMAAL